MNNIISSISFIPKLYAECAAFASRMLVTNWVLVIGSIALYLLLGYVVSLLTFLPLGILGSFIGSLLSILCLSTYYSWLSDCTTRQKISLKQLIRFDAGLFSSTLTVSFILWIFTSLTTSLLAGQSAGWLLACIGILLLFIFNSLPEVIYIERSESFFAFQQAAEFTKKHLVVWYLPLVILLIPWWLMSPTYLMLSLAGTNPLLPLGTLIIALPSLVLPSLPQFLLSALGVILVNWLMLFRGKLFQEIESGSARSRAFQRKLQG